MESISSRRHPIIFYLALTTILVLGVGIGVVIIILSIEEKQKPTVQPKYDFLILLGIAIIIYSLYAIHRYIKNTFQVTLKGNTIAFNKQNYLIEDIECIEYTGKHKFPGMPMRYEGMKIIFKNGNVKYVFDMLYANTPLLKQFLKHRFNTNANFHPIFIANVKKQVPDHYYYYTGNPYLQLSWLNVYWLYSHPVFCNFSEP
jgi:hypothetical protein